MHVHPSSSLLRVDATQPVPEDHCVSHLTYEGTDCRPNSIVIEYVGLPPDVEEAARTGTLSAPVAQEGCVRDGWWSIRSEGIPTRHVRLVDGLASLRALCSRFGLMDVDECVHKSGGTFWCDREERVLARRIPAHRFPFSSPALGVPQRLVNSGICWYASLCFVLFGNEDLRPIVLRHLPERCRADAEACLTDAAASERLRKFLWDEYGVGDRWGCGPEEEGQNGGTQLGILAAQIGLPLRRLFVHQGKQYTIDTPVKDMKEKREMTLDGTQTPPGQPHLLLVRFRRGNHSEDAKSMPERRVMYRDSLNDLQQTTYRDGLASRSRDHGSKGRRYRLVGILVGSEACSHQIGCVAPTRSWKHWSTACADARRRGVTAIHWKCSRPTRRGYHSSGEGSDPLDDNWFWGLFRFMVPLSSSSAGVCDMRPINRGPGGKGAGRVNVDFLYLAL